MGVQPDVGKPAADVGETGGTVEWCLGIGGRPPTLYKLAAALRFEGRGKIGGERVERTPTAGVGETGGCVECGPWDATGCRRLCKIRPRL